MNETNTEKVKTMVVLCPNCKKEVKLIKANQHRPFCSQRCKTIDFGEWASENYKIEAEQAPDGHDEDDY